jgi:Protein of unknown function (DUF4054)
MTVTSSQFRADFPEFSSTASYPDRVINFYLNIAGLLLNVDRWDTTAGPNGGLSMFDVATELLVAHNITLRKREFDQAQTGAAPGMQTGILSSKSTGPISASYTTAEVIEKGAGFFAMTEYGSQFWGLVKMFGAGVIQVGVGVAPPFAMGAWAGPWPWPLPAGSGFSS